MCTTPIDGAAETPGGGDHLTQGRQVADAQYRLPVALKADQDTIERHALHKGLGAIDWVEDPAIASALVERAPFFAEDAMVGKTPGNQRAQVLLGLAVGDRHR